MALLSRSRSVGKGWQRDDPHAVDLLGRLCRPRCRRPTNALSNWIRNFASRNREVLSIANVSTMCVHGNRFQCTAATNGATMSAASSKAERLQVRVSGKEKATLERAAAASKQSSSEFIRGAALHHAEHVLADRRHFELDAEQWERFESALERVPLAKDNLKSLLQTPSVLDTE